MSSKKHHSRHSSSGSSASGDTETESRHRPSRSKRSKKDQQSGQDGRQSSQPSPAYEDGPSVQLPAGLDAVQWPSGYEEGPSAPSASHNYATPSMDSHLPYGHTSMPEQCGFMPEQYGASRQASRRPTGYTESGQGNYRSNVAIMEEDEDEEDDVPEADQVDQAVTGDHSAPQVRFHRSSTGRCLTSGSQAAPPQREPPPLSRSPPLPSAVLPTQKCDICIEKCRPCVRVIGDWRGVPRECEACRANNEECLLGETAF